MKVKGKFPESSGNNVSHFKEGRHLFSKSCQNDIYTKKLTSSDSCLRKYTTISCLKTVFAALWWHFPSHNNVIWLTHCFESLQWKILVGDMYFFQYNFHPHISANNCGKLQKNGITIWWSNRWFVLNSIVFSIYLSQSHLWQNIPKHVGDPTWKFIQNLFIR